MRIEVCSTIDAIPSVDWDRLVRGNNPFLRHAFLAALEHNNCATPTFGWQPMHLAAWEGEQWVAAKNR
ncbi:MAG: peptidogalycan biosysnthesis protein [Sedimenticola sp.]